MSTYIPNVQDYVPEVPLFSPNFGLYQQVLQYKAGQYEKGKQIIQSAYDAIANTPLSTKGAAEIRDRYLTDVQQKLKDLSKADLSLQQNVDSAERIFAPFWEDKYLLRDMALTKKVQSELSKYEMAINSTDKNVRETAWQTGRDYVLQSYKKLQNLKYGDDEIFNLRINDYVPYFDVDKFLNERAKESGFDDITVTTVDGRGYKITRKNGEDVTQIFQEWAMNELAMNPQAMDVFRVRGAVSYQNKVDGIMYSLNVDEATAKSMLADEILKNNLESYRSYENEFASKAALIKIKLEEKLKKLEGKNLEDLSEKEQNEINALKSQYERLSKKRDEYERTIEKLNDPEKYQQEKRSIVYNGESYFAESERDTFVRRWGRNRALDTSVSIELDPVFKMYADLQMKSAELYQNAVLKQQELQFKEWETKYNVENKTDASGNSTGSNTNTGRYTPDGQEPLDVGRNIYGDMTAIEAANRLVRAESESFEQFINSGLSTLISAGKVDPRYVEYLEAILKGDKTKTFDLRVLNQLHQKMQQDGWIPKDIPLQVTPTKVFKSLFEISKAALVAGDMTTSQFQTMLQHNNAAEKYYKLKTLKEAALSQFKDDKDVQAVYENGRFLTKSEYLKKLTGYDNFNDYSDAVLKGLSSFENKSIHEVIGSAYALQGLNRKTLSSLWEDLGKSYDDAIKKVNKKIGPKIKPYLDMEDGYIAPMFSFEINNENSTDRAKKIASQVLSDENLANQLNTSVNVDKLVTLGAKEDEVKKVVNLFKNDVGGIATSMDVTEIGRNGIPSARFRLNAGKLAEQYKKTFGEEISPETINSINQIGIEINITRPGIVTMLPEFDTQFTIQGIDKLVMDKRGEIQAPQFMKELGLDYKIRYDKYAGKYLVEGITVDGKLLEDNNRFELPDSHSLSSIQDMISSRLMEAYFLVKRKQKESQQQTQQNNLFSNPYLQSIQNILQGQ